jgi:CoA:oxalate CoA-transferase
MSRLPLAGKTVVDLTTALSGPYATLLLAGLGARVIKIENPATGGDSSRNNSPYLTDTGISPQRERPDDMSISMLARGRNKESVVLDLKHPLGRGVLLDLIEVADVLVENFSAGVTARLGVDYASVRERNPRLVYTSISGFGAAGAGSGTGKAMDTIIQAMSGVMMTAGAAGDPPVRFGLPVADTVAPLYAVIGTLAAVLHAEHTGEGQHVDVSMLGTLTSILATEPFSAYERLGLPQRTGQYVPRLAPFGLFEAKDAWFALCAPVDHLARGVLEAIGRPDLVDHPRFATRDGRVAAADELHAMIGDWAADRSVDEVIETMTRHGAPAAQVLEPADAVRHPLVLERGEVVAIRQPGLDEEDTVYAPGMPMVMSGTPLSLDRPAPGLGADTLPVLRELLGYDDDRLTALRSSGAL